MCMEHYLLDRLDEALETISERDSSAMMLRLLVEEARRVAELPCPQKRETFEQYRARVLPACHVAAPSVAKTPPVLTSFAAKRNS